MRNKIIFIGVITIGLGIAFFLFDQSRVITYDEFIAEIIGEDEEIIEITISNRSHMQSRTFNATIKDQKLIEKIIQEPSMQLKKERRSFFPPTSSFENVLYIKTKEGETETAFEFDELYIHRGVRSYKVLLGEESPNRLYDLIQNEKLEWVEN